VRRVLKKDGTLWMNLGDSYAGVHTTYNGGASKWQHGEIFRQEAGRTIRPEGLKPKDLCGIPWRVAFALQTDGWYLRQDIIWAKPNPMPESVTDRCTKAHEYLFLLSKSERYFYDADAIREPQVEPGKINHGGGYRYDGTGAGRRGSLMPTESLYNPLGRNKRSVWTVPTAPYPEAHFATYPPDLIKPCVLAGSHSGDTILDPFAGSGTTGAVAIELGRKALLIELNPAYIPLIERRCSITPGFAL
jgi:DNA modification methylase